MNRQRHNFKYNYSIVIPHYNDLSGLVKLINSIPNRNDIETIVIDDNSDSILSWDEVPKRENIKILINNSGTKGAGACRNIGLSAANSKWILFCDSDDYLTLNAFNIIDQYLYSDADIIHFKPTSIDVVSGKTSNRHIQYCEMVDSFNLYSDEKIRFQFEVPWSKLISSDLINRNQIKFDEIMFSNDVMFSIKCGHLAKKIECCDMVAYCVTSNPHSLTKNRSRASRRVRFHVSLNRSAYLNQAHKTKYRDSLINLIKDYNYNIGFNEALDLISALINKDISFFPYSYRIYISNPRKLAKRLIQVVK